MRIKKYTFDEHQQQVRLVGFNEKDSCYSEINKEYTRVVFQLSSSPSDDVSSKLIKRIKIKLSGLGYCGGIHGVIASAVESTIVLNDKTRIQGNNLFIEKNIPLKKLQEYVDLIKGCIMDVYLEIEDENNSKKKIEEEYRTTIENLNF